MTDPPLGLHAPAGLSERVRRRPAGDVETQLPSTPPLEGGRLAAVWFADIVGYTSLSARDHAGALALVDVFQASARSLIEEHGGRLVKFTGDGVLAEFSSTSAAVRAANALQREFAERSAAAGRAAELRIGVHVGEVAAGEDGDIYGDGVNTASRLEAEAQPGRVLVSEDVWHQLSSRPDLRFEPLGKRRLSGIPRPIAVFEASPAAGHATRRKPGVRGLVPRLTQLRGRYLLGLVAFHALAGWLLLEAIARVVARGSLSEAANPIALIWYIGAFPAILLVGWYHGYRRHRNVTRSEVALLGALAVSLIVLSASALARQAREAALTATGFDLRRVAVLYFEDLTQGEDREFLAAGLTEDLIDELAGVRALDVISRNGVAPFRGTGLPRDSIAGLLAAGTLVDGSIEQVGERIRMNVRLVDGASGAEFRRAGFEFPADEVFDLRAEMVEEVSQLLRAWLGEEVELRERQAGTQSVAAWSLVQRAEENLKQADEALHEGDAERMLRSFQTADSLLARAERLDAAWAEPTVLRGTIDYRLARLSHDPHEALHWIE
ncbi:MAG: adenylate/guanylate cyclase domain-containing protein, partial [Longimicrobiales bacterium]